MSQNIEDEPQSTSQGAPSLDNSPESREQDLKEREIAAREREIAVKELELQRSRWSNPVVLALLAAAAGLIGNAILARINNQAALETERRRGQSTLIVEAMKTGKPEDACRNLVFFVNLKLIDDPTGAIKGCAADPRGAPVLPSQGVQQPVGLPKQETCTGLDDLNQHVYRPARLEERGPCLTVSGIVAGLKRELDGDYHMNLRLDSGQSFLLNEKNLSEQNGNLVVEIICANPVTQPDATSSCEGYESKVSIPAVGQHVIVVGRYVLDRDHQWMEIHPALKIIQASP